MKIICTLLILISTSLCNPVAPEEVYICISPTAIAYHKSKTNCKGIRACTHDIKKVSKEDAIKKFKYRACRLCF